MFITTRKCSCGKHQLGVHCTRSHAFWCRDCNPVLFNQVNMRELSEL